MAKPNQSEAERQKQKDEFIEYFEDVPVIKYAAFYVGIDESTAYLWIKDDTEFSSRINQAKSRWARKRALQTKAEFQLERLDKEVFREQKDVTSNGETLKTALVEFVDGFDSPSQNSNTN